MNNIVSNEGREVRLAREMQPAMTREPWHAPIARVFDLAETQTGANSTTDLNATLS